MSHPTEKRLTRNRGILFVAALFVLIGAALAFSDNVITRLDCTDEEAQTAILNSLLHDSLFAPVCNRAFKAVPADRRAGIVTLLGGYTKSYVNSPTFREHYMQELERMKPAEPEPEHVQSLDEQTQQMDAGIKQMEAQSNSPYLSEEQKREMREAIAQMKQMAGSSEMKEMYRQGYEMQIEEARRNYEQRRADYTKALAEWEQKRDINFMLRKRLKEFLDLTDGVAFDAKLVQQGNRWRFADAALEQHNDEWKKCFRAGREAVDAARAFASAWLRELGG